MLLIDRNYFKYFLLFIPYLLSAVIYTQISDAFANVLLLGKLISFVIVAFLYLKKGTVTSLDVAVFLYCVWWFASVIINSGSILEYVKEVVTILFYLFIIEESFFSNNNKYAIKSLSFIVLLELFVNFVLLIIFPEGLWSTTSNYDDVARYNFLGLDNQVMPILLLGVLLLGIGFVLNGSRITLNEVFCGMIILGNVVLMQSGTAITAMIVVVAVLLLATRFKRVFNVKIAIYIAGAVLVGIVVFRIQNIFAFFIEGVLEKDLSLTNRVTIWDRAIGMIAAKPIVGYGIGTLDTVVVDRNAHNFFLQIILQSGIVGLALYLNIFRIVLKRMFVNISNLYIVVAGSIIVGYIVCCITEVYAQGWLILILSIAYCAYSFDMPSYGSDVGTNSGKNSD